MPGENRFKTPLDHPVIWKLTRWARLYIPGLENVTHRFCGVCEEAHVADERLYAHTFHDGVDEDTVCWSRAMLRLSPNTLAGICLHEFGHILAGDIGTEEEAEMNADLAIQEVLEPYMVSLTYRGTKLTQWVNFKRLLQGIEP